MKQSWTFLATVKKSHKTTNHDKISYQTCLLPSKDDVQFLLCLNFDPLPFLFHVVAFTNFIRKKQTVAKLIC